MNTAQRPSLNEQTQQKLENNRTKRLGKKTTNALVAAPCAHLFNVVDELKRLKLLKDVRYFVEWRDDKNPKEYSGLPNGYGVYIRISGWLNGGQLLYDIKIGKGKVVNGRLTRDKGGNQGLQGV